MAILAIAIVMISLGTVSAVDDTSFNQTAISANDYSQDLNLVDVNNANVDDGNTVDIAKENQNDELKASDDEDILGEPTLTIMDEKESYTKDESITIKMGAYAMASDDTSVDVYLNNAVVGTTTYGVIKGNSYTFSLSNAAIGENTIYCVGSSMFESYTSDSVTFTVVEGSQSGESSGNDGSDITLTVTDAYSKYDGQSSSMHFPYTEDYVFIATTGNNARYNAVVTFKVEGASSSAKIKFGSTEQSISSGTATLEFNTDNLGENTIYVVDGSKKSNEVKVYVVSGQNKIASLSIDPDWGVEGQNVTITPTAMSSGSSSADGYTPRPISGYVTFYSSSSYTDANRIGTVSTDGGSLTVPLVDINAECDYIQLYYTFSGEYNNKGFIHSGSKYVYFLVLDSNPIALTGNGQTGEINPDSENKVNLHVTPTYYMNDGTNSFIDVYVGTQKVGTFSVASTTSVNDYELDFTGYEAGDYDVYVKYGGYNFEDTNGDVYYHAGNESNHLTVHIEGSTTSTGTLTVSVTNTTYGNTVATVTAGQAGTYTLKINDADYNTGIVFDQAGSQEIPITGYAAGSSQYSATVVDNNDASLMNTTTFTISQADADLQVTLTGNNTLLADTQTVTVSANGNGKVRINNGEEKDLGEITLENLVSGMNTVVIYYTGDENYTSASQTIYVNIKGSLTITLARNGEGLVKPGDSVGFTIKFSNAVSDNLELWINDYKLNDEDGSESTSITFNESDIGSNEVFIKFLGNDDFEACESNRVIVNVVEPVETTVTLEINTTDVLVNGKILITPKVVDSNGNNVSVGTVTIGKDLYGNNDIARINVGESYEYSVDSNSHNPYNNPYFLYARYSGATGDDAIYKASQTASGTRYYHVYSNTLTLTVNGENEVTVPVGSEVNFLATLTNGEGRIVIVDKDGVETEISGETPIKFDTIGDFTYYAKFTRSDNSYYASVQSSPVTVHVTEKQTNEITVSVESITLPGDVTIQVTATKAGNYTVKINDTANTEVKVEVKADGETGSQTVTLAEGNYSAAVDYASDIYNVIIKNATFTVSPEEIKEPVIVIRDANAPDNATVKVTALDEYTVEIEYWVNVPEGSLYTNRIDIIQNTTSIATIDENIVNKEFTKVTKVIKFTQSGIYNITAKYSAAGLTTGSVEEFSNSIIYDVTIKESPVEISVKAESTTYPNIVNVTVTSSKNGEFTLYVNETPYDITITEGTLTKTIEGLAAGDYKITVVSKEDESIRNTTDLTVSKADAGFTAQTNATSDMKYGDALKVTYTLDSKATGTVTLFSGETEIAKVNAGEEFSDVVLNAGTIIQLKVVYSGDNNFTKVESDPIVISIKQLTNNIKLEISNATYPEKVSIKVTADLDGNYTINILDGDSFDIEVKNGVWEDVREFAVASYNAYLAYKDENPNYFSEYSYAVFTVSAPSSGFNATAVPGEVEVGQTVKINTSVKRSDATGNVTVILPNGSEIEAALGEEIEYVASEAGEKTFTVKLISNSSYANESVTLTVKVNEKQADSQPINLTEDVLNITGSVFALDLPTKDNGTLFVTVNNKTYNATVSDGKGSVEIPGLDAGNYTATVSFVDDKNNVRASKTSEFSVPKEDVTADKAFNITSPTDSTSPTFSIDLPGATGNLTVKVGNKTYTKELADGKASITVDDLNPGEYNVTVSYSGDGKHSPVSKNATISIPTPILSNGKNINAVYGAKAAYKVRLTVNGNAVAGQYVAIRFNGKTFNVKTDKDGYTTLNIKTNIKVKSYTITATYKGVKQSNKVTVKHLIKAKNLKIKKSRKVVKIKVNTNKVNGKFLKGKKLKLKLKGKTLKAKINKKGVATFKVKKNILKKLKVGKKYKYTVTYGKDKVTKKINVKR